MNDAQKQTWRDIIEPFDPKKGYGGIDRLWVLPASHPFNYDFWWHDQQYNLARAGWLVGDTSKYVDQELLRRMLKKAGDDPVLIVQAFAFYDLCRAWGAHFWPGTHPRTIEIDDDQKRLGRTSSNIRRSKKVSRKTRRDRGRPVARRKASPHRTRSK